MSKYLVVEYNGRELFLVPDNVTLKEAKKMYYDDKLIMYLNDKSPDEYSME